LGAPSIVITQGNSTRYLQMEDTIKTRNAGGFFGDLSTKFAPAAEQLQATLSSLDAVLRNFNSVLDPATKNNLQNVIANMNMATKSIMTSSVFLQQMLNQQSGS